jgi:hypothetical protein
MPLIRVVVSIASTGNGAVAGPFTDVTARGSIGFRSAGPSAYTAQQQYAKEHKTIASIRIGFNLGKKRIHPR